MGGQRRVTPGQACPRPNGFGRNLRSKTRWFTGFCNSHQVSHFATFFIDARAEISVAESRFDIFEDDDAARAHRFRGDGDALSRSSSLAQFAPVFVCFDNDPSAGSPTETLLRLLLPLNDKVRWTSRDVAGSEPPTSPRSEHFTGPFNRLRACCAQAARMLCAGCARKAWQDKFRKILSEAEGLTGKATQEKAEGEKGKAMQAEDEGMPRPRPRHANARQATPCQASNSLTFSKCLEWGACQAKARHAKARQGMSRPSHAKAKPCQGHAMPRHDMPRPRHDMPTQGKATPCQRKARPRHANASQGNACQGHAQRKARQSKGNASQGNACQGHAQRKASQGMPNARQAKACPTQGKPKPTQAKAMHAKAMPNARQGKPKATQAKATHAKAKPRPCRAKLPIASLSRNSLIGAMPLPRPRHAKARHANATQSKAMPTQGMPRRRHDMARQGKAKARPRQGKPKPRQAKANARQGKPNAWQGKHVKIQSGPRSSSAARASPTTRAFGGLGPLRGSANGRRAHASLLARIRLRGVQS
ncbi:unnamed protein product [Prunus brigantina]